MHIFTHRRMASCACAVWPLMLLAAGCSAWRPSDPQPVSPDEELAAIDRASQRLQQDLYPYQVAGNLFGEMLKLRSMEADFATADGMLQSMYFSQAATIESFIGNVAAALELYGRPDPVEELQPADPATLTEYQRRDALDAIVQAAADSRAVFVNEAHHVPQHRVLTRQLLPLLRQQGFTHFAAETLSHLDLELEQRGYPASGTGYYTREPLYADLVRLALSLGYEIVAYESLLGRIPADRETEQARHLAERIFTDPEARAVVHLGYSHNAEAPDSFGGVGAMASHFKTMTGIDPLTVDQTRMTEQFRRSQEHPLYRYVADELGIERSSVFVDAGGRFWRPDGDSRDITVFLPRTRYQDGRPDWLRFGGERQPLPLPADICGAAERCLVEARLAEEGDGAIPIDRVEVVPENDPPVLLVPVRELDIRALDGQMKVLRSWTYSRRLSSSPIPD